jgi:hypothetical protein
MPCSEIFRLQALLKDLGVVPVKRLKTLLMWL